ncbi:MAG: hypothetical protein LBS43_03335 [Prevotellaceae bacterium]|jgi:hypothetical protein|nr:hypothetical protein [Prevotellaceae bacterium]
MMKKKILKIATILLLILAGWFTSCGKGEELLDLGMYIETYPFHYSKQNQEWRFHINFIDKEKLAIIRPLYGTSVYEFYYAINTEQNSIYLTPIGDPSLGGGNEGRLYFKIINSSKFEIEDLYYHPFHLSYGPYPNMIFEKENIVER